uniref:CASP-like protein n=1 Tax=Rhizophora mucronata TaxID=61149 RepID=A0A2P2QQT4_RHIMU
MEPAKLDRIEASLRLCAILLLILSACLVGLDSQTKFMIYLRREVTYKSLKAFPVLVYVDSAAAAYNLLQLSRFSLSAFSKANYKGPYSYLAWGCYLLDQLAVYMTFGATTAATEHSILVVTGVEIFQWTAWCNKFTRFCLQIGGALLSGYLAFGVMVLLSFISAFNVFRLYSPKQFLRLKAT